MASKVSIANSALSKIGRSSINSLDDNSEEARTCNERYSDILEFLIQDHPWNFSTARQELAQATTTPEFGYSYKYTIPSNCIQVIGVEGNHEFKVEEDNYLHTDNSTIELVYIKNIDDPNELPAYFRAAFSLTLAAEICYKLTSDIAMQDRIESKAGLFLKIAKLRDAQEGTPDELQDGSWISVRG